MSNVQQLTHNLPTTVIRPTVIGIIAAQTLRAASIFSIRGVTSRGIFTLVDERTIVFLSRERYKGPLIANIPWTESALEKISLTSHGQIVDSSFVFSDIQLVIDCSDAQTWSSLSIWHPSSISESLPTEERLIGFLIQLLEKSENELISAVLGVISGSEAPHPDQESEIETEIRKLSAAIRAGDENMVTQSAHFFAGRGRGLTPSGDDFLLGIVYGLFNLKDRLNIGQIAMIRLMADTVNRRSTLISANLVDCAAIGEVDERIGAVFYALFDPAQSLEKAVEGLLTWGSSSGLDAAAGLCILLNIIE